MAANIYDWSLTAANNSNADGDITWAEGQAPSTVNDSARVLMQRIKEFITDIGGSLSAGGTANGLTVTAESAFTAYANGQMISFRATADNSGAATLNVNGVGAKSIRKMDATGDVALVAGEIQNTGIYVAMYSAALNGAAGGWLLINPTQLTSLTDQMEAAVSVVANKTYTLRLKAQVGGTITEVTTKCLSGTCNVTTKINTTALGGTANAASSTRQSQAHASANVFVAGDDIVFTVSANAACLDLVVSAKYTRALA